jgi:alkanesulfonate monooxygenase SsuD/methylene tetrahydromethanopterin reductase-like flavin-dependent oxidoreductase (luciferase family)
VIYDLELNSAAHYPPRGVVELGQAIEDAGFDAFWKGEANSPDPFVVLTGLARGTRALKLGTAIVHVHARSAVTLGVQAATLQEVSRGRLLLGVGVANRTIAAWHGREPGKPLGTVREYLSRAIRVAAGERLDGPRPFALAWKPEYPKLGEIARHVHEGARAGGRDPASVQIAAKVRVTLHPDRARARDRLRELAAFYTVADHYQTMLRASGFEDDVDRAVLAFQRGGLREAQRSISDAYLDELPLVAATSFAELRDRLRPFEAAGATRLILPYVPVSDAPLDEARRFIDAWAKG